MITEDYCSFELSKLLKEKGFDEECEWYYPKDGSEREQLLLDELNYDYQKGQFIKSPSHALAMKWLRDKQHIHIMISIGFDEDKMFYHPNLAQFDTDRITYGNPIKTDFSTYEKAVEAAIKYCLTNLINNETN